jgi:hypothetical protein
MIRNRETFYEVILDKKEEQRVPSVAPTATGSNNSTTLE